MSAALKAALEDLLRTRRLQAAAPPLRGEDLRPARLPTGIVALDGLLGGGFARGRLSEICGRASSGRTGLLLATVARATRQGTLCAWVDPGDRLDPLSASEAGVDLSRLLWMRGEPRVALTLPKALAATSTLSGSGLFGIVVLDLAGRPLAELRRLPSSTWIRMQRVLEEQPTALLLLADSHLANGPNVTSLVLAPVAARFSGARGPGRLLSALVAEGHAGRPVPRRAEFTLQALA